MRRLAAQIPGATIHRSNRQIILPGGGEMSVRSADNPTACAATAWTSWCWTVRVHGPGGMV